MACAELNIAAATEYQQQRHYVTSEICSNLIPESLEQHYWLLQM